MSEEVPATPVEETKPVDEKTVEQPVEAAPVAEAPKEEAAPAQEAPKEEAAKEDAAKEEAAKEEAAKEEEKEEAAKEEAPKQEEKTEEAAKEEAAKEEEAPKEEAAKEEEAPKEEAAKEEAAKEEEAPKEEEPKKEEELKEDPNSPVDKSVTFKGYGVVDESYHFVPVEYHPRKLGPTDVEIRITHSSICASDLHTAHGGWGHLSQFPTIVGHEIVGVVSARGPKAKFKLGERLGVGPQVWACLDQDKKSPCASCHKKNENHCPRIVYTYNSRYADGEMAQGGYADHIRVDSAFAFPIPKDLESKFAAPLMCAGVTVFAPLLRYKVDKKKKVGVVGVGGLGHLALQFAAKLGAEVYALSTSRSKEEDAKALGAKALLDINDPEDVASVSGRLDVILFTANGANIDYNKYIKLLGYQGTFVLLALPEAELHLQPGVIISKEITVVGSIIANRSDTEATLKFASKHKIRPMIQEYPMEQVNDAVKTVLDNKIRYRAVLVNPSA